MELLKEKPLPHSWRRLFYPLAAAGALYALFAYKVDMDDFFITMRYAQNLANGKGWVFNEGERVLGTTSPLLTVLIALFSLFGCPALFAVRIICALALFGTSHFLFSYFTDKKQEQTGFAAGLLIFFILPIKQLWGNEIPLCLFFLMASLSSYEKEKWTTSSIFLSLYALSRMEGLLLLICLNALLFLRKKKIHYRVLVPPLLILVPWFVFSRLYFGDFLPNTLYAKARQGARPDIWSPFASGFFSTLQAGFFNGSWPILSFFSLVGLVPLLCRRHALLIGWCALHQGAYFLLGVPGEYLWYYYPLWLLQPIALGGGIFLVSAASTRLRKVSNWDRFIFFLLLCLALFQEFHQPRFNSFYRNRHRLYKQVSGYIRDKYPEGTELIADEIGIFGYYLPDYTILDTAGLVHRDIPQDSYFYYNYLVQTRKPELIINCRYPSGKEDRIRDLDTPLEMDLGEGKRIRYRVKRLFPGSRLLVRILEKQPHFPEE